MLEYKSSPQVGGWSEEDLAQMMGIGEPGMKNSCEYSGERIFGYFMQGMQVSDPDVWKAMVDMLDDWPKFNQTDTEQLIASCISCLQREEPNARSAVIQILCYFMGYLENTDVCAQIPQTIHEILCQSRDHGVIIQCLALISRLCGLMARETRNLPWAFEITADLVALNEGAPPDVCSAISEAINSLISYCILNEERSCFLYERIIDLLKKSDPISLSVKIKLLKKLLKMWPGLYDAMRSDGSGFAVASCITSNNPVIVKSAIEIILPIIDVVEDSLIEKELYTGFLRDGSWATWRPSLALSVMRLLEYLTGKSPKVCSRCCELGLFAFGNVYVYTFDVRKAMFRIIGNVVGKGMVPNDPVSQKYITAMIESAFDYDDEACLQLAMELVLQLMPWGYRFDIRDALEAIQANECLSSIGPLASICLTRIDDSVNCG
jgi:hypothetical protein